MGERNFLTIELFLAAGHSDCGRGASGFPGIYSDINFYMEWILDNIEEWLQSKFTHATKIYIII